MKIPKDIELALNKRGWKRLNDEPWRHVKGMSWSCAYFEYKNSKGTRTCLITVAKITTEYLIQILYAHPVCSMYSFDPKIGFNVKL